MDAVAYEAPEALEQDWDLLTAVALRLANTGAAEVMDVCNLEDHLSTEVVSAKKQY